MSSDILESIENARKKLSEYEKEYEELTSKSDKLNASKIKLDELIKTRDLKIINLKTILEEYKQIIQEISKENAEFIESKQNKFDNNQVKSIKKYKMNCELIEKLNKEVDLLVNLKNDYIKGFRIRHLIDGNIEKTDNDEYYRFLEAILPHNLYKSDCFRFCCKMFIFTCVVIAVICVYLEENFYTH